MNNIESRLKRLEETVGVNEENHNFPLVSQFVENCWEGDVFYAESAGKFNSKFLLEAEQFLKKYPEYLEGLPFPGDNLKFDKLLNTSKGAKVLQKIVDMWD